MIEKILGALKFPATVTMETGGYRVEARGITALVKSRDDLVAFAQQVEATPVPASPAHQESSGSYYSPQGDPRHPGAYDGQKAAREWAQTLAPVDAKVSQQRNVYVQRVGRREALYALLQQLYRDCEFFLDRKKRRAEEMLGFLDSYFAPLSKGVV